MQTGVPTRLLGEGDIDAAVELSTLAGWNQTAEDWRLLLELAPQGCFGLQADGRLVSTTTVMSYGHRVGWIGMVLTHPDHRGHGFAHTLLRRALEHAESKGIQTLKLDATEQGRPIYESLGFRAEQRIERWERRGSTGSVIMRRANLAGEHLAQDCQAVGFDRSELLNELTKRGGTFTTERGFVLWRRGRNTSYLGPCTASNESAARELIGECLNTSPDASWSWDLLRSNAAAGALAREMGFARQRTLTRMRKGDPVPAHDEMVYAIAGFELG